MLASEDTLQFSFTTKGLWKTRWLLLWQSNDTM